MGPPSCVLPETTQAIHTVSKLGDLNWDEESLLSLLHAGLHEALKTEDVENKATLRLLEQVQSPFNQLLLRDDCSVIPLLGKKQETIQKINGLLSFYGSTCCLISVTSNKSFY